MLFSGFDVAQRVDNTFRRFDIKNSFRREGRTSAVAAQEGNAEFVFKIRDVFVDGVDRSAEQIRDFSFGVIYRNCIKII